MKKRLLLIGYNFYPEPTGIGKYSGEMISWFVERGYDCTVITSYPYYPFWKIQEPYFNKRFWYSVEKTFDAGTTGRLKIYRCPQYVPNKPTGLKRILLDLSFILSACLPLLRLIPGKKFDYVMAVAPSFQIGFLGLMIKKFHKAKLLYHIQDLQIEAARDLKMIKSKVVLNFMFKMEKHIFNQSDTISTISSGMAVKVREKSKRDVLLFPNWTDTKLFYPIENKQNLKRKYGYEDTDKIILYSGSIGEKQGIDSILHVANQLRNLKNVKFIICGSGPYKQKLQQLSQELNLENVNFMPIQPHANFNRFLNLADIHLVIQKAGASDLVMPSKLTTILAVGGLALITADKGSGLHSLVSENNIGVLVKAEDPDALKEGILTLIDKDHAHINKNARKYAENFLSMNKIMDCYEQFIQNRKAAYGEILPQFAKPEVSEVTIKNVVGSRSEVPILPDTNS